MEAMSVEELAGMATDAPFDTPTRKRGSKKGPPLTPRSAEACSMMGILPSELMPRPPEYFRQKGSSARLQQRRFEHYESRRQRAIDQVREARKQIIANAAEKRRAGGTNGGRSTMLREVTELSNDGQRLSSEGGKRSNSKAADSAVEIERLRLERMQRRQQAEIQQMLMHEVKLATVAEENKRKEERDAARQRKLEAERRRKREAAEASRRDRELQRAKEAADLEEKAKQIQARLFQEGLEMKKKREAEEKLRRKMRNEAEAERRRRQEQRRQQTEAIFEEQQREALKALEAMNHRDAERNRAMEERHRLRKQDAIRRKAESDQRILLAQEEQAATQEKRFRDYQQKEALAAERRAERAKKVREEKAEKERLALVRRERAKRAKEEAAAHLKAKADAVLAKDREYEMMLRQKAREEEALRMKEKADLEKKRQARRAAYDKMIARQEARIHAIEAHRLAQEQGLARQAENNDAEAEERRLRDELREEDRRIAKERAMRREKHRRERIEAERKRKNDRADQIAREREQLKQKRMDARIAGMKKRAQVATMFDKIQTMGGSDMEKIEKQMAKKFGMKPIAKSVVLDRNKNTRGRPSSAQPRRRKKIEPKSATVVPTFGQGDVTPITISDAQRRIPSATTGSLVGGSARKAAKSSTSRARRVRPKSAAVSRSARKASGSRKKTRRPGSAASSRKKGSSRGPRETSSKNPELELESLRARQNEQLLRVLEQEQEAEERRERILRGITDEEERRRLDKVFGIERAKSSQRIMRITEEHEMVLASKMAEFGIIR